MKKPLSVLMISFHFPPVSGSSGYLRLLKFAKFLPQFNVQPTILTVKPFAYETIEPLNEALLQQIDPNIEIHRVTTLDTSRHLSIKGKYLSGMALPDKWMSWIPFGVLKGFSLNRKHQFDAIWVTYPISSALVIALLLAKLLKKQLFVDLRDPVWEEETWQGTKKQKLLKWIEQRVVERAEKVIFTSPGTVEKYKRRYNTKLHKKFVLLLNGYDEDDFKDLPEVPKQTKKLFLHSGLLPTYERDPQHFFQAISELKKAGQLNAKDVVFRLRATGLNNQYQQTVTSLEIDDLVDIAQPSHYKQALAEMYTADYLMIFQHRTCDWQIPAKLFEYFNANKPLLLFAGKHSDTVNIVKKTTTHFAHGEIDQVGEIKEAILACLNNQLVEVKGMDSTHYARKNTAKELATLLSLDENKN